MKRPRLRYWKIKHRSTGMYFDNHGCLTWQGKKYPALHEAKKAVIERMRHDMEKVVLYMDADIVTMTGIVEEACARIMKQRYEYDVRYWKALNAKAQVEMYERLIKKCEEHLE